MEDINEFIDFDGLFMALYNQHKEELKEDKENTKHFFDILQFVESGAKSKFELIKGDCYLSDLKIIFVFGIDFDDANESTTQSTTADYTIVYHRPFGVFTACDYEQG